MRILFTFPLFFFPLFIQAQTSTVRGTLKGAEGEAIAFANVALFNAADSSLYKAGAGDDAGVFEIRGVGAGDYFLKAVYLGLEDLYKPGIRLNDNQQLDLGVLAFSPKAIGLTEATVTASRVMVEVKPDRTIFNVAPSTAPGRTRFHCCAKRPT